MVKLRLLKLLCGFACLCVLQTINAMDQHTKKPNIVIAEQQDVLSIESPKSNNDVNLPSPKTAQQSADQKSQHESNGEQLSKKAKKKANKKKKKKQAAQSTKPMDEKAKAEFRKTCDSVDEIRSLFKSKDAEEIFKKFICYCTSLGRNIEKYVIMMNEYEPAENTAYICPKFKFINIPLRKYATAMIKLLHMQGLTTPDDFITFLGADAHKSLEELKAMGVLKVDPKTSLVIVGKHELALLMKLTAMLLSESFETLIQEIYNEIKQIPFEELDQFCQLHDVMIADSIKFQDLSKDDVAQARKADVTKDADILEINIFLLNLAMQHSKPSMLSAHDHYGIPLLCYAAFYNSRRILPHLIKKYSLDVNIRDWYGRTPLIIAAQNGNIEVAQILLDNKADVHVIDKDGGTALIYAMQAATYSTGPRAKAHRAMIELLRKHKAAENLNGCDWQDHTPLCTAIEQGKIALVDFALQCGTKATVTCPDKSAPCHGKMSLNFAQEKLRTTSDQNYKEIVKLLTNSLPKDKRKLLAAVKIADIAKSNNRNVKARMFKQWQHVVSQSNQQRALMQEKVAQFRKRHVLKDAFKSWKKKVDDARDDEILQEKATTFRSEHDQAIKVKIFKQWQHNTAQNKQQKILMQQKAAQFRARHVLKNAFKNWKKTAVDAREREKILQERAGKFRSERDHAVLKDGFNVMKNLYRSRLHNAQAILIEHADYAASAINPPIILADHFNYIQKAAGKITALQWLKKHCENVKQACIYIQMQPVSTILSGHKAAESVSKDFQKKYLETVVPCKVCRDHCKVNKGEIEWPDYFDDKDLHKHE
jgi:hypothetical protein